MRAILDPGSDSPIGLCGVSIIRGTEEGEIWYLLAPEFWGRGVATAAAKCLLDMAFGDLQLHRVWAGVALGNPASARVLRKAGLRLEGRLRGNLKLHGEWMDSDLYAILADEWPGAGGKKRPARNGKQQTEEVPSGVGATGDKPARSPAST